MGLNVKVEEPDVSPLAIQGPYSEDLMVEIFGNNIKKLKFFNFNYFDFKNTKQLIAKSGYSSQLGFEIYLNNSKLGEKLWDTICSFGKKYNLRPGAPNLIDRIEAGLLSFGNDMTSNNSPTLLLPTALSAGVKISPSVSYSNCPLFILSKMSLQFENKLPLSSSE